MGLDGKRGAKRFLCAAVSGGGRVEYPAVKAGMYRGCHRAPLKGGKFCAEHEKEVDSEEEEEAGFRVVEHRVADGGAMEFLVEEEVVDGEARRAWFPKEAVAKWAVKAYELRRLPETRREKEKKKKRRKASAGEAVVHHDDEALVEHNEDKGPCGIDKGAQAPLDKKHARRRLGGVLAAVSGCRIFLDWEEHQGGESTTQTWLLLARLVDDILENQKAGGPAKLPDVVFQDNACSLRAFARNPLRSERTSTTRAVALLHFMLDIWHVRNHTRCLETAELKAILDPRAPENEELRRAVDTEACEQAFSFLDRITYHLQEMGPGTFHAFMYLMLDLENERMVALRAARE